MRHRAFVVVLSALAGGVATGSVAAAQPSSTIPDAVGAITERIEASRARIDELSEEVDRLEAEHGVLVRRAEATRARLARRIRALLRAWHRGGWPWASRPDALAGYVAAMQRMRAQTRREVEGWLDDERRRAFLEVERRRRAAALEDERARLQALESRRASVLAHSVDRAFETVVADAPWPDELVLPGGAVGWGRLAVRETHAVGSSFGALRGRLELPVDRPTEIRDDAEGLLVRAAAGSGVRAVADGRVAVADVHGELGRLVVLDHGGGWFSVYAGLEDLAVLAGDEIARGARLGRVGSAPLRFELRRGSRPLDVRGWLAPTP
ncbi:MAG: M23 family metallopeptidase [Myxococcota bacterium]|nr:M23 family metallopeptidase [Myxococcota bacterium]MDW8361428.1 peptidoglycan DD-metalloendopeptidase family protein [Myxococcales bacterium]